MHQKLSAQLLPCQGSRRRALATALRMTLMSGGHLAQPGHKLLCAGVELFSASVTLA